MIITSIKEYDKKRSQIYIDGEKAFLLYKGEIRKYKLEVDQELDQIAGQGRELGSDVFPGGGPHGGGVDVTHGIPLQQRSPIPRDDPHHGGRRKDEHQEHLRFQAKFPDPADPGEKLKELLQCS